jgi:hypothetical protein
VIISYIIGRSSKCGESLDIFLKAFWLDSGFKFFFFFFLQPKCRERERSELRFHMDTDHYSFLST